MAIRSIALGGILGKAIQRSEHAEEKMSMSDAVERLWQMGFELTQGPIVPPLRPNTTVGPYIEAEFHTLCGCTRRQFIPRERAHAGFRFTIYPKMSAMLDQSLDTQIMATVRTFEFDHIEYSRMADLNGDEHTKQVWIFKERV